MTAVTPPYRVLIVEDDPDVALLSRTVLEKRAGCSVMVLDSSEGFAEALRDFSPDVVLSDIELPGASGLDLLEDVRQSAPHLAFILITAHASVDYAVRALHDRADAFLTKPVPSATLVETVTAMAAQTRERRASARQRTVLAIGAHPDDVEIGVGGILARHAAAGDPVVILTLSRGARGGEADDRQHESLAAAELIGARLFLEDLEDTRIPNTDPTVAIIERVVKEIQPGVVYTHSSHDRHQDHRAVHEAALVATRSVPTIACFQSPSATIDFRPTRFIPIDGYETKKLEMLKAFSSQATIRDYLEPDFVLATARYWSRFGGGSMAEPLEIIRDTAGIGAPAETQKPLNAPLAAGEEW